jgi:hypothetical protein
VKNIFRMMPKILGLAVIAVMGKSLRVTEFFWDLEEW